MSDMDDGITKSQSADKDGAREQDIDFDERVNADDDGETPQDDAAPHQDDDIREAMRETIRPLLDDTTYGSVQRGDTIKSWEIEGLIKPGSDDALYSPLHLANNPPKLTFKSFREPQVEEYSVYLDKYTAQQLADALDNVVRAYKSAPLKGKKEKWTVKSFKTRLRHSFEYNPLLFVGKITGVCIVVALLIMAIL